MAALFRRDKPIRPAFITPPAEPRDLAAVEDEIEHIDHKLLALVRTPHSSLRAGAADRLLDLRNAIRPPRVRKPPVVSGRAESSIANYQENPW